MKIMIKAVVVTLLLFGLSFEDASAETLGLLSKCLPDGTVQQGENPSFQQINCLLTNAALNEEIPPEVVKAVAFQESSWEQFNVNGDPVISADGGIGIMQVTNQANVDQDKLKNDIVYNIEAGVQVLSSMYDRTDLPKIKAAGRQVIENWYFPVMAYNGTKPANSPIFQDSGLRNKAAYQEKVFASIVGNSFLGDTTLGQFPFQVTDFQYDRNSDENIVFLKKEYTLTGQIHKSVYYFKKGDKVAVTVDNAKVRKQPGGIEVGKLAKNTTLLINGNIAYDQSGDSPNQFVWYPVTTVDQKLVGYISSAYITTPDPTLLDCSQKQYMKGQKIFWNGIELKAGQIGRLTIVQNTSLFKLNGTTKIPARTLKKGEFYRIYAFKPGMLSVGGGYYVDRNTKVKYETPSKAKLNDVKCIANLK